MAPAIAKTHIATSEIATATQPRCSSVRPRTVLGLTEEQRGWVAVAIALVAMCVLAIAGAIGGGRA